MYKPSDFSRLDESPDTTWYSSPRFVQHIDNGAISALKEYYNTIIKPSHSVLDICSSWVSHLPDDLKPENMIGYGMNAQELSRNSHLRKFFVKDLNVSPSLSEIPSSSIDTVICNVSVDYLTQPIKVFEEMKRVLKDGGTAHMAFSNRCFPTKVIGKWRVMNDEERRKWVGGYFWKSDGWDNVEEVVLKEGGWGDPLFVVRGRKAVQK
jgi:SAM-dependent methyltransferase